MSGLELRARSLIARGELALAASLLRDRILQSDRPSPRLLNLLGVCEARQGHPETAKEAFTQALLKAPANPSVLTNLGNLAFMDGDHSAARAYYTKALRQNLLLEEPRFNMVRSYQEMGHFEKAMNAYEDYVMVAKTAKWSRLIVFLGAILLLAFLVGR